MYLSKVEQMSYKWNKYSIRLVPWNKYYSIIFSFWNKYTFTIATIAKTRTLSDRKKYPISL